MLLFCGKKVTKKPPTKDYSPFVGYSYVHHWYYCSFDISSLLLVLMRLLFLVAFICETEPIIQ